MTHFLHTPFIYRFLSHFMGLFLVQLCLYAPILAQETTGNTPSTSVLPTVDKNIGIRFGIRAGANIGSVVAPIEEGSTAQLQILPAGGVFCYIPLGKRWSLLPEILYSAKGASFTQKYREGTASFDVPELGWVDFPAPYRSYNLEGEIALHYLEMPIQFAYRYGKRQRAELTFGIQVAYLLKGESYTKQDLKLGKLLYSMNEPLPQNIWTAAGNVAIQTFDPLNTTFNDTTMYISDQLKSWDFGFTIGGNYQVYQKIHVGLRCSSSVASIFRKELNELQDDFLNLFMQLTASYQF